MGLQQDGPSDATAKESAFTQAYYAAAAAGEDRIETEVVKIDNLSQKMKQFTQHDPNRAMKENLAARIAQHVRLTAKDVKQAQIVDVGCGVGTDIGMMLAAMPECAGMKGVDLMDSVLEQARQDYPAPTEFLKGDIHDLHFFEDSSQDVVRCSRLLIHAQDLRKAVDEMIRILKPGGLAAFVEGDASNFSWETEDDTVRKVGEAVNRSMMQLLRNPATASEVYEYAKSHSAVESVAIESDVQFMASGPALDQTMAAYRPRLEALVAKGDISQAEMDRFTSAFDSGDAKFPCTLFTVSFTKK